MRLLPTILNLRSLAIAGLVLDACAMVGVLLFWLVPPVNHWYMPLVILMVLSIASNLRLLRRAIADRRAAGVPPRLLTSGQG